MKKIREMLFNRWVLGALVVLALSLVVLLVGDAIAVFDHRPLETALSRWLVVLAIVLAWLAWELLRAWRVRRANQSMLAGIAGADPDAESSARSAQEIATLQARFKEAMVVLRKARFKGRAGEKQYLYQLPWYVFIGAPGSGKTTALINSGLKFPLEEQSVKGVGGTRNCDWWFTDEAVLLDTAGRYVTQDSEQRVDASAWLGFLDLLKRFRPRRPLNGAIITVSISDLLYQSDAQRERYAKDVRQRVQELYERLGLRFPVYVMVTKVDLLAGFTEFFGDMSREERAQVWGSTFALNAPGTSVNYAGQFGAEFEGLERRLHARVLKRLHSERDLQRRCAMYSFPQQFSALRPLLSEFLEKAFGGSRFGEQPLVRGVYFTSGTQEGSPIDRVLGTLSRTFNLERKILPPAAASGKSFFINRLLHDVIFMEAGLGGGNEKKERQHKWLTLGAFGMTGALTAGLLAAWTLSYFNNGALIEDAAKKVAAAKGLVASVPPAKAGDIAAVLPVLNELRDLPAGYARRAAEVPASYRFGLYQGDGIGERSVATYRRALGDVLLTRASLRLEELLTSRDLELLYVALRGYLMLHQDKHLDPADLARLLQLTWRAALPRDSVEAIADLEGHLKAAFEARPLQMLAARNDTLVNEARRRLASMPLADRVYARLKSELSADASIPAFRISEAAGPDAAQVFTRASGQPLTAGIEGLFTREGYLKLFRGKGEQRAAELSKEEAWVLGDADARTRSVDPARVAFDVRERYLQDYEKQWLALFSDIRLIPSTGLAQTIEQAKVLSAPDSPLKRLVAAAAKELSFANLEDAAKAQAGKAAGQALNASPYGRLFAGAPGAGKQQSPEEALENRFAPLRNLVAQKGAAAAAPIDTVLQSMSEFYTQLRAAEESLSRGQVTTALGASGSKMRADADRYPEPVRSVLRDLAQTSTGQAAGAAKENIKREISGSASFCAKAIAGKYPFSGGARGEVLLDDFNKVFSPGGQLDAFFTGKLAQFVDTPTGRDWRVRPGMEAAAPSAATIRQYQRAALIRDSFFRSGSPQAQVTVDVRVVSVLGASEVTLEHDGKVNRLSPGGVARVQWPSATPGAGTRLVIAGAPPIADSGPWALFRVLDRGVAQAGAQPGLVRLAFAPDAGHRVVLELQPTSVNNPFHSRELREFQCPG